MIVSVPSEYTEPVVKERAELWRQAERARYLARESDQRALTKLADEIRQHIRAGARPTGGHLRHQIEDITAALNDVYDQAFPVHDPADLADVLDTPWWTASRVALLQSMTDRSYGRKPERSSLVDQAIASKDARLLRLLIVSPVGHIHDEAAVRALDALHEAGELDAAFAERALRNDPYMAHTIFGRSASRYQPGCAPASCAEAIQEVYDDVLWQLTASGNPDHPVPQVSPFRGLRFVRRVLDWPEEHQGTEHPEAKHLGATALCPEERSDLIDYLRGQPWEKRLRAFNLRLPAGDADELLPLLELTGAEELLALIRAIPEYPVSRQDHRAILAAVERAGTGTTRRMLELIPSELVEAALGWNRAALLKRIRHNALWGIASYGMLPLDDGETVLDRYLTLRAIVKRGGKLGPNRRISHAAAIEIALDHLAQMTGFPDADRLEWECEARVAAELPPEAEIGDYKVGLRLEDTEPVIAITNKAGKRLKSVPASVREHASYSDLREHQNRLRDQARRMRTGLIERLVATGGTLQPDEVSRLRHLPCGDPLLSALLWQDQAGTIGWLADIDQYGPVAAVHPFTLYERGELARWQKEIVQCRVRQPVKQVFRELYLLTPAEREAKDRSLRFAGHKVDGKVASQLLSRRGWSVNGEYSDYQATRPASPGLTAGLVCDEVHGYLGLEDAVTGEILFTGESGPVPLEEVPPVAFSEVMRDIDLVVSVAGTEPDGYASPFRAGSRAQLLGTLIADLDLDRVTVEGTTATVRGSRATYRVNLTSGSIHLEPGGYLCIVPKTFGNTAHRRLFLPFADEDHMTSVILSKVLLLSEDERMTDRVILDQLP